MRASERLKGSNVCAIFVRSDGALIWRQRSAGEAVMPDSVRQYGPSDRPARKRCDWQNRPRTVRRQLAYGRPIRQIQPSLGFSHGGRPPW